MFIDAESLPKGNVSSLTLMDKEKYVHCLIGYDHEMLENVALEIMIRLWGDRQERLNVFHLRHFSFLYKWVCLAGKNKNNH